MSQHDEWPQSPKPGSATALLGDEGKALPPTVPEQNGRAMEIPEGAVVPVATYAPPIPQAILTEPPEGEATSLDIVRKPGSKGGFSLPHPLLWHHWLIFWSCAGTLVILGGLVIGLRTFWLAVSIALLAAFVIKFMADANRKPRLVVQPTVAPLSPAQMLFVLSFGLWCLFLLMSFIGVCFPSFIMFGSAQAVRPAGGMASPLDDVGLIIKGLYVYFTLTIGSGVCAFATGKMASCLMECKRITA